MKKPSAKKIILLVILLVSTVFCLIFGLKVQQTTCSNLYILSLVQEDMHFLNNDILAAEKEGMNLSFVKYLYPQISNGFREETAIVIATNDNYSYFAEMELVEGTFFNQIQADKKMSVAVLNKESAYQFFGNYDCIGENIYLDQNAFRVIGIVNENGNEDGNEDGAKIYVPDKTVDALGMSSSEVNQLWVNSANMAETSMAISAMGYSMDEIDITQMDLYKDVFMQRFYFLVALVGIIPLAYMLRQTFTKAKELREGTEKSKSWFLKLILQITSCIGILIAFLRVIQLAWVIPPNYDVVGKDCINVLYEILEFYTLYGIKLDNMQFVGCWNLLSLLCLVIGLISLTSVKSINTCKMEKNSLDRLIEQTLNNKAKTIDFSETDLNRLKHQIHIQIEQKE